MNTRTFVLDVIERSVKTGCQTLLALLGAGAFDILNAPWTRSLAAAGMAAVLSVLSSIASSQVGDVASASLVTPEPTYGRHAQPDPAPGLIPDDGAMRPYVGRYERP